MTMAPDSTTELSDRLAAVAVAVQQSPEGAVDEIDQIAEEAVRRGDHALAGDARYLSARCAVNLGQLDDALLAIDLARDHYVESALGLEAVRTGLGRMHVLDDLGRHDDAIAVGHSMLVELASFDEPNDADDGLASLARLVAATHDNIGVSNGIIGRHHEALDAYALAEAGYRDAGLQLDAARCVANQGVELLEMGRAEEAIGALRRSRPVFFADGDRLFAGLCAAYEASGHVHAGDFVAGRRLLAESEELLADGDTTTDWARAQLIRAETLLALNLVDDADALYTALEERFADTALRHDRAIAVLGRGGIALRRSHHAAAGELLSDAADEFTEVGDQAMTALARLGLSYVGRSADQHGHAVAAAETFEHLGRNRDEIAARLRLAELSGPDADEQLDRCRVLLDDTPLPHLRWQVLLARAERAARAGRREDALGLLTQATAVIERVRGTVVDERSLVPFMGSRRDVHEALVRLHLELGDPRAALAAVSAARSRTLMEYTGGPGAAPAAPTACTQIVYEMLGDELMAFVSGAAGLRVHRNLTDTDSLRRLVQRLSAQWRRFGAGVGDDLDEQVAIASTLDPLQALYDLLIRPLGILAASATNAVLVVPVGMMANVPFAALHDGERYLVERCAVALAASPDTPWADHRPGHRQLVVGLADENAPLVADEIEALHSINPDATVLTGDEATADTLVARAAAHDIVHVACHGVNRADNPALSALRLADRELTALEISQMDLDGQLVVLSACSSGRQHAVGNVDELLGLPRAFLAAGANGVVVNLWPVDDATAAELMTDFHRRLALHGPIDALRSAQRSIMQRHRHPYHWAPTAVYVGAPIRSTTAEELS